MRRIVNRITVCIAVVLAAALLASCGSAAAKTTIEMELTKNYDTSDPFVNAKLIYVSADMDSLDLDASFQMRGESGTLEIVDRETGDVIWTDAWDGTVGETKFTITLANLEKEKEYVIRFTGTKIDYAKIVITSESSLVKERERPQRPNKG